MIPAMFVRSADADIAGILMFAKYHGVKHQQTKLRLSKGVQVQSSGADGNQVSVKHVQVAKEVSAMGWTL